MNVDGLYTNSEHKYQFCGLVQVIVLQFIQTKF